MTRPIKYRQIVKNQLSSLKMFKNRKQKTENIHHRLHSSVSSFPQNGEKLPLSLSCLYI